jgi:hypothetical protein
MLCGYCPLPLTYGRQSVQVDFCIPVVLVFIVAVITNIIEDDTLFIWMLCFIWQEKCRSSQPPFFFFSRMHLMIHSVFNVIFTYCVCMYNFNFVGVQHTIEKCWRFLCLLEGRQHNLFILFCYLIFNPILRFRCQGISTLGILLTLLETVLKNVVVYIMKYILKWLRNFMIYIFGEYFTSDNNSLWAECWNWVVQKMFVPLSYFIVQTYMLWVIP